MRIYSKGKKAINRLSISATNTYPNLSRRTVTVNAMQGVGILNPNQSVEFIVQWPLLPNVPDVNAPATIDINVQDIAFH